MPTVQVQAELSVDELIEAASQLSQSELEQFVAQVLALQARRKAPSLSQEETALLMRINSGLPAEVRRRYQELIDKRREERLTQNEYEELLRLTDTAEKRQAERLEALVELSRLRNVPLPELMQTLGIKQPVVE
jgi:uncharacterized protein (DUF1778 family)